MKRSVLVLLSCSIFLLYFVPMTLAQQRLHSGCALETKMMHHGTRLLSDLNLTEEQKSKLADLRLAHQKEMLPLRTEIQGKMAELQLLKTEDQPDIRKIDQLIEDISKIKIKMQKSMVRHQLDIRGILTPEQKKIFNSKMLTGHRRYGWGRL